MTAADDGDERPGGGPSDRLRVCTFNVRYDTPADGPDAWPRRRESVVRTLRGIDADVVGLQEPLAHQYEFLRTTLEGYEWYGVGRRRDGAGERCPIAWRATGFDAVERETRWLSPTPSVPGSVGWDASHPRIATRVRLRHRGTGTAFDAWNVHLDHEGRQARIESARLLSAWIDRSVPTVLLGDLNATPSSPPHTILRTRPGARLRDARGVAEAASGPTAVCGPAATFHGFTGVPTDRIDYVFVRGFGVDRVATVARSENGAYPSDHFPVVASLRRSEGQ